MKTFVTPTVDRLCVECGNVFKASLYDIPRGYGVTCSKRCAGIKGGRERAKTLDQDGPKNVLYKHGLSRTTAKVAEYQRRALARFPQAFKAKQLVQTAVKYGRLTRQPCERCGEVKVEAHHDDYSLPLAVRWLCSKCHRAEHKALAAAGIIVRHQSAREEQNVEPVRFVHLEVRGDVA